MSSSKDTGRHRQVKAVHGKIATRESGFGFSPGTQKNMVTVLGWQFRIKNAWLAVFACDCGTVFSCLVKSVSDGATMSCGCYHRKKQSLVMRKTSTTHGQSGTRLFRIWGGMKARCYLASKHWNRYGGRGISVCAEWKDSFVSFRDWSMRNGYSEELEIDRINNDGNYEPSNCRWATRTQQNRNTCKNRYIEAFGELKCLPEWEEDVRCNVSAKAIWSRLKSGWSPEDAISKTSLRRVQAAARRER